MPDFTDYYLRFDDEPAGATALTAAGFDRDYAAGWAIDRVGTVYTDDDPPVALAGWHVNLRLIGMVLPDSLTGYVVTPASPARVWAS